MKFEVRNIDILVENCNLARPKPILSSANFTVFYRFLGKKTVNGKTVKKSGKNGKRQTAPPLICILHTICMCMLVCTYVLTLTVHSLTHFYFCLVQLAAVAVLSALSIIDRPVTTIPSSISFFCFCL